MKPFPGYVMKEGGSSNQAADVIAVQAKLGVWQTGTFGPTTAETVAKYQKNNGIGVTAEVGQQTWGALFGEPAPPAGLGVNAASWANGEVGVQEDPLGSNWGHRVAQYLDSVGISYPAPWCAAFVYWSFQREADGRGVKNPLIRSASCSQIYGWARDNGKLVTAPLRGDIFLCVGGDTGHYHTGFVSKDPVNNYFQTIEGNSNMDGSSNGVAVVRRDPGRSVTSCDYARL